MFSVNDDLSIYITRGDTALFNVTATMDNGENYVFRAGDVVRFKVTEKKACENVMIQKDFAVSAESETVEIFLSEEETKIGDVISKPTDYWYEIELNPFTNPQTLVGYDDEGAKIFKLFPEGKDLVSGTKPDDVPVVDAELDPTSDRPVQNQAVSRAFIKVEEGVIKNNLENEKNRLNIDEIKNKQLIDRVRINNLSTLKEGSTTGDAELIDGRVGFDGKIYDNIGESIRTQIQNIDNKVNSAGINSFRLNEVTDFVKSKAWFIANSTNEAYELINGGMGMTNFIPVNIGDKINICIKNYAQGESTLHITQFSEITENYKDMLDFATNKGVIPDNGRFSMEIIDESTKYIRIIVADSLINRIVVTKNITLRECVPDYFFEDDGMYFNSLNNSIRSMKSRGLCSDNLYVRDNITEYPDTVLDAYTYVIATDYIDAIEGDLFVCKYLYEDQGYAVNLYGEDLNPRNEGVKFGQVENIGVQSFIVPKGTKKIRIILTSSEKEVFECYRIRNKQAKLYSLDTYGDSINQGYIGLIDGEYTFANPTWQNIVSSRLNMTVNNFGIGGTGYSVYSEGTDNIDDFLTIISKNDKPADYCLIFGGINDYFSSELELGDINSPRGGDTLAGKIKDCLYQAYVKYQGRVLCITPIRWSDISADNKHGYNLIDLSDLIIEICDLLNIKCLNGYKEIEYNLALSSMQLSYDNLHPNQDAYNNRLAPVICNFIDKNIE